MTNNLQRSLESVYTFLAQYKRHEVPTVGQGGPYRVFVPEGEHIIRLLFDPEAQLLRTVTLHQTKQYQTYCPDLVRDSDPSGVYPLCKICTVATERGDWRLQRAEYVLMYGHLCTTSNASDFWKPGKSYLMIERTRIISPLTQLLGRSSSH